MKTLLDYFGAAYLINLPERKDRLKSATAEFARAGWRLGPDAVQLYAAQKFTDRAGFPGSASVRGCFHSHIGMHPYRPPPSQDQRINNGG